MKIVTWNIAHRDEPWRQLLNDGYDIALLQEAGRPPDDVQDRLQVSSAAWDTASAAKRPWRTAVVGLSDQIQLDWIETRPLIEASRDHLGISCAGTIEAATVTPGLGEPITLVSVYSTWEKPVAATGSSWIYADAAAHRVISGVSALIGFQTGHNILIAGDFNILRGYGESGSQYWAARYATIFDRFTALGLRFMGPESPNGRIAEPWPDELPKDSSCVPTYHTTQDTPATATRQLDFVFASEGLADKITVRARNEVDDWGPSDHCRVEVLVGYD
jgi:hypothetical protein